MQRFATACLMNSSLLLFPMLFKDNTIFFEDFHAHLSNSSNGYYFLFRFLFKIFKLY